MVAPSGAGGVAALNHRLIAATPPGSIRSVRFRTGGVATLNHRLIAATPTGAEKACLPKSGSCFFGFPKHSHPDRPSDGSPTAAWPGSHSGNDRRCQFVQASRSNALLCRCPGTGAYRASAIHKAARVCFECYSDPRSAKVRAFLLKVRKIIREESGCWTAGQLIERLNPLLRGWAFYHRHASSKAAPLPR